MANPVLRCEVLASGSEIWGRLAPFFLNHEIRDVPNKLEDLSSIMANVDVTLRALFVKVPLKLWGDSEIGTTSNEQRDRCRSVGKLWTHGKLITFGSDEANSHLLLAADFEGRFEVWGSQQLVDGVSHGWVSHLLGFMGFFVMLWLLAHEISMISLVFGG